MKDFELIKGSRFQRVFPEPYFYGPKIHTEEAGKDIENYYDKLSYSSLEAIAGRLMKYNNTRLQYLLKLYYKQQSYSEQDRSIYFIHKSAAMSYKYFNACPTQKFFYDTLWTDIKYFFSAFHADFVAACLSPVYHHFKRRIENFNAAFNFCDAYFKWLSQKLSEKGKVSFNEVEEELKRLLTLF
jgi:hypothetical protein